jgi:hypothetical protein
MEMIVGNNRNRLRGPLAAGCAAVLLLALSPAATSGGTTVERPLKGACDTTFELIRFEPPTQTTPTVNVLEITLDCNLSHLGRVSGVAIQRVTLQPPPFPITTEIVYEAANGDLLNARFTGFAVPTNADGSAVQFAGVTVYAGGTGRFAQAAGSSQDTGTASLATSTGTIQVRGRLAY